MKCAVDRNMSDPIDIAPLGCKPVSFDRCESGYMANKDDVFLPGGKKAPMDQCCQCKPGKICRYCKNEEACTEYEKMRYVASEEEKECFDDTSVSSPLLSPSEDVGPSPEPEKQKTPNPGTLGFWKRNLWIPVMLWVIVIVTLYGLGSRVSRYSAWRPRLIKMAGAFTIVDLLTILIIKFI